MLRRPGFPSPATATATAQPFAFGAPGSTVTVADEGGAVVTLGGMVRVAIDDAGNVVLANCGGIHVVTGAELSA